LVGNIYLLYLKSSVFEQQVKYFKQYIGTHSRTKQEWTADIGYERFLGPEIFFNPEMFSTDFKTPLSEVVDSSIINCKLPLFVFS
jgi:actin-related protein 3